MWPNLQFPADLVAFTEEILNGKLHFLCSGDDIVTFNIGLKYTTLNSTKGWKEVFEYFQRITFKN